MQNSKIINRIYKQIKPYIHKFSAYVVELFNTVAKFLKSKITSWWQVVAIFVFAIVFLYYPIGGWLINDTSTPVYQAQNKQGNLYVVDSLSHLINQEVHHKIWTPNLPILFPSYFLDNMPNFQLGIMSAVGNSALALKQLSISSISDTSKQNLYEAAELLQYPGTIWLMSPQNKLVPATSSNTQYKKGRRLLNKFNNDIAEGKTIVSLDSANFATILQFIKKDLSKLIKHNEDHIRENSSSVFDFKCDDVFYFAAGKLYAYAQITNALGQDFKEVLVKYDIYQQWTGVLKLLDKSSELKPVIIRNGKLDSSFAPNHLATINYYASYTVNYLNTILNKLSEQ